MYRAKFNKPLTTAEHIKARNVEGVQDDEGGRHEHVVSGAKLVCDGSCSPEGPSDMILHVECVGELSNGRPLANAKHNNVDENFEDEGAVYFGTCEIKQDNIAELEELQNSDSSLAQIILNTISSIANLVEALFGDDASDDCEIEFDPGTYWENYAEGVYVDGEVNGDRNNANALYIGESFIYCKHGGRITVEENGLPDEKLISQALLQAWAASRGVDEGWGAISQAEIEEMNAVFHRLGITGSQIHHALAQIAAETGYGRWLFERPWGLIIAPIEYSEEEMISYFNEKYGSSHVDYYVLGNFLGDDHPNNGSRFRGAGFKQLTGRTNYQAFAINLLLEEFPELRLPPHHAEWINPNAPGHNMDAVISNMGLTIPSVHAHELTAVVIDALYEKILEILEDDLNINMTSARVTNITRIVTEGAEFVGNHFPWESFEFYWRTRVSALFVGGANPNPDDVTTTINPRENQHNRDLRVTLYNSIRDFWEEFLAVYCFYCGESHEEN